MKLGFLTAARLDVSLEQVGRMAAAEGFDLPDRDESTQAQATA